jgi:L-lactate utilization protein LutB|tara:strand:+ start:176 stop:373 length:198 start_codon:yes stop_codon:yes gene_type:complete
MATKSQQNREELIRVEGELKLLKQELRTIKTNHLYHLDLRVSRIEKIMWGCTLTVLTHLIFTVLK